MDFELNEEQRMIRDLARGFAEKEIAPIAAEIDETGDFPHETIEKMGDLGLMGLEVSPEWGGAGADTVSYVLAVEEISKVCASHGVIMSVNNSLVCYGIQKFGTDIQKERFLKPLASGRAIGAFALTEPQSGSDAGNIRTTAVRSGNEWVLNGRKSWITSGPVADYIITFVSTDPEAGHRGTSAFIVDTSLPGFNLGKVKPKLGIRASATCEITFEDYRLSPDHQIGEDGMGFKISLTILDAGRIGIAAQANGIAQAAYQAAVEYAKERRAFGQPIAEFQAIQFKLADMHTRIEAARLLTFKAAVKKDRGEPFAELAAMAKLYASETANWVTYEAIQIHGGMGYSRELPIERYYRDARITTIYEGTSEIQRLVIARGLLGKR